MLIRAQRLSRRRGSMHRASSPIARAVARLRACGPPPSCARLQCCTVALREAEKSGEMGVGDFGISGVKYGLTGVDVLNDAGLRSLASDRFTDGGGEEDGVVLRMCGNVPGLSRAARVA